MSRPLALVTGGAGLIGSHVADLLLAEGWRVRILDNLEPQTHRGRPSWIPASADFREGDVRDVGSLRDALTGVDTVFHEAAYGGYMPEIAKYFEVNSVGTARLLEIIRDDCLPVRKVVVASSQAVYREGAVACADHGLQFPPPRLDVHLAAGDYRVRCPLCERPAQSAPTPERAPVGGETVYAMTKLDQERMVLAWGRQTGIPTVALRYSCTYGPRQSIRNPYTGVIAIFATQLLNCLPPVLYEDGEQTRDLCFVEDIARANLLAAVGDGCDGLAVNVGTGRPSSIRAIADAVADALGVHIAPLLRGEYRPGEMRDLTSDITLARTLGYEPSVSLERGIARYVDWIRDQGDVRDYFTDAQTNLRRQGIIRTALAAMPA